MRRLRIIILAVFGALALGSCVTPPDPIPVIDAIRPTKYRESDGTEWHCYSYPIRALDGSVVRVEEFCQ